MTYLSYCARVPGKLMIAGEYAVLEPKKKAVVIAVNRYVTAYIKPSRNNQISLPQFGLENITWKMGNDGVRFSVLDCRLNFIQNSIAVAAKFLQEKSIVLRPFKLKVISELDDPVTGQKYGLGSSAAVVVSIISAILSLHSDGKEPPTSEEIFKLSAIVHLETQGNGSGADIAAAVYGGWLEYSAYSCKWILKELHQGERLTEIIGKQWPNLSIRRLTAPSMLHLAVGWTKAAAATAPMIKSIQKFRENNIEAYREFLRESTISVEKLIRSFEFQDCTEAIKALSQTRKALLKLGERAGTNIETSKLKVLCSVADKFGSGKSSGAGGGDCGIAFLKNANERQDLYKAWKARGITPLDLTVSKMGAYTYKVTNENWSKFELSS